MNNVSQLMAQSLKKAGWVRRTREGYGRDRVDNTTHEWQQWEFEGTDYDTYEEFLYAPNISELREELTKKDFRYYFYQQYYNSDLYSDSKENFDTEYTSWLYTVTASADSLAEIWIWRRGRNDIR